MTSRLATAQLNGQSVASYTYNAVGQRVGKDSTFPQAGSERYGYSEAGQLIGEYGSTNRDYIWLGDIPVAVIDNAVNGSMILPLFHGHPDKRFTIAIRGERDDPEEGINEDRTQAV